MRSPKQFRWIVLVATCCCPVGCGNEDFDLAEATGRITIGDQPVPSGVVTFVPDETQGTSGPTGTAHLSRDGTFAIETLGRPGAIVGAHKVRVNLYLQDSPDAVVHVGIPERYMHESTSGLAAQVRAGERNEYQFILQP